MVEPYFILKDKLGVGNTLNKSKKRHIREINILSQMTDIPIAMTSSFSPLFIADLPREANEIEVLQHFEKNKFSIFEVIIYRNYNTNASYCTGKITFFSHKDADQALHEMNYSVIMNKEIRLMRFQKGSTHGNLSNIFVKNLPLNVTSKTLHEKFSPFGGIFSAVIRRKETGESKGYGYVQYENREAAQTAIGALHNSMWEDNVIDVIIFRSRKNREPQAFNNLYVKCFPKTYTDQDLTNLFEEFGEIVSAVVIKDNLEDAENKGFGFVCFKLADSASKAVQELNDREIGDCKLYVGKYLPKNERKAQLRERRLIEYRDCNLYVKKLPFDIDDKDLEAELKVYGNIVSTRVMKYRREDPITKQITLISKGFGFVCFKTKEEASNCLNGLKNNEHFGAMLYANIAQSREFRSKLRMQRTLGFHPMPPPFMFNPYRGGGMRPPRFPMNRGVMGMPMGGYPDMHFPMGPPPYFEPGHRGRRAYHHFGGRRGMEHHRPAYAAQPKTDISSLPFSPTEAGMKPSEESNVGTMDELSANEDIQSLGERLYPLVEIREQTNAAKITGMLLEMEKEAIVNIIKDERALERMIMEAQNVLKNAQPHQE